MRLFMMKIFFISTAFFIVFADCTFAQLLAFPTAEGAGKFVSGGRGNGLAAPAVFEVTTLDDNAASSATVGTLRYACTKSGFAQRIIVFRVSGTIHLYNSLSINRANTTIAGQTAPGEGICIADHPVKVTANNVIIRYLRFRLGDKNQAASIGNDDALSGLGVRKVIIDHCSISWSNDEACSFYNGDSITLQWNLISEPLDRSFHDEGAGVQNHAYGGIWGGKHASFHHNLLAHCRGRMPRFDGIRNIPADSGDFRNNVVYNWADYNTNGGEGGAYNVVNNYYKYGLSTLNSSTSGVNRRNMLINPFQQDVPPLPYGMYYLDGNHCDNSPIISEQNWKGASFAGGSANDSTGSKVFVPFHNVNINMQSAADAFTDVLAKAGCSLPNRDTLDQRIVNDVKNRTGKIIDVQGGFPRGTEYSTSQLAWPALENGFAQTDTDHDGMPDNWELARGLNAQSTTDLNGHVSTSGYSNIENYINGDTIVASGKIGSCVNVKTVYSNNTGNWLWARDSTNNYYLSETYTSSTDSNHIAAAIVDNSELGSFEVSYYTTASLRYDPITSKPYLNRNITINPVDASLINSPVKVRLYFSKAEFNALMTADPAVSSIDDLVILKNITTSCMTELTVPYTVFEPTAGAVFGTYQNGYFVEFETASFGTFFIGGKISFPLPLKLLSFTAAPVNSSVTVHWITANEINFNKFIVERSVDGINYAGIGTILSNNTSGKHEYSFVDDKPFSTFIFYRLKIVDKEGRFSFSDVAVVRNRKEAIAISPNPVNNLSVFTHSSARANSFFKIINTEGREVTKINLTKGSTKTDIPTASFALGHYILVYVNDDEVSTIKFIKL
jgi:hypothetical protein